MDKLQQLMFDDITKIDLTSYTSTPSKRALKEATFKLPKEDFTYMLTKLIVVREEKRREMEQSKQFVAKFEKTIAKFLSLLEVGKEKELLVLLNNGYRVVDCRREYLELELSKIKVQKCIEFLEASKDLKNNDTQFVINFPKSEMILVRTHLINCYKTMATKTAQGFNIKPYEESLIAINAVIEYKKDLINCTVSF